MEGIRVRLSATDLSNHLGCRHATNLDLDVAHGNHPGPEWRAPDLAVIRELGMRHEAAYLDYLRRHGLTVEDIRASGGDDQAAVRKTCEAMQRGVDVIAQGSLAEGRWFGRLDVLRKVTRPSQLGNWSYEVQDCKLSRETKATTILQLALYSALLGAAQGATPEFMHVVPPGNGFARESYRCAEYAAYYRYVKSRLEAACDGDRRQTYPEPCAHCDVCRWFAECDAKRRADDDLSLVAGITRQQRKQFTQWQADTVARLAELPIPLRQKPRSGAKETYQRKREQARVQVEGRTQQAPVHELLEPKEGIGLALLPAPSRADVFLDLEGDPFAEGGGRQYLFGMTRDADQSQYAKKWCFTAEEEKLGFEWAVEEIMACWAGDPNMHIYHFGAHEPTTLKRLMGTYATCEEEIDRMLRAKLFVDLHTVVKQAVRASVEEYSLKALEPFYSFARQTPLAQARTARRLLEHRLELGDEVVLTEETRATVEGYNEDDCRSLTALRNWLESGREKLVRRGVTISRPAMSDGAPTEELSERQKRAAALAAQLMAGISPDPALRSEQQSAQWMMAQLLDWHRRENKAAWWEGFRLEALDEEALLEERVGLAGLKFEERVAEHKKIPTDRYSFFKQECEVRSGEDLYLKGQKFGCVAAIDLAAGLVEVKKTRKMAGVHPGGVYMWSSPYNCDEQADALFRIAEWIRDHGVDAPGRYRAARDLLLRLSPRLRGEETLALKPSEGPLDAACRIATALETTPFAIQGPPGAGKTYSGARMICRLVRQGKKIGITAHSHQVIRKLLDEVVEAAAEEKVSQVRCLQKNDDEQPTTEIVIAESNSEVWAALASGEANVVGGTAWLWAPQEACESVDVLFVDEAGQMALADVMAVAHAAKSIVLLGDPQQLERPLRGSHPPGAEKSALQHLLGERKTIPETMGLLLPETHRLHPAICEFTSELFYEGRLRSKREVTENRVIEGHPWINGAGLWFVPAVHEANRNSSAQEVEIVAQIAESLLQPGVVWFRGLGNKQAMTLEDVLIVAPYNAQVADISARLPGALVGTVDKFQGQEAPVVVYSLTTSSPEDAPRGMEFLYSLNRLNVATSRGQTAVVVVGSPRLFEPECRNPRQMLLANALCRFLEMAKRVELPL